MRSAGGPETWVEAEAGSVETCAWVPLPAPLPASLAAPEEPHTPSQTLSVAPPHCCHVTECSVQLGAPGRGPAVPQASGVVLTLGCAVADDGSGTDQDYWGILGAPGSRTHRQVLSGQAPAPLRCPSARCPALSFQSRRGCLFTLLSASDSVACSSADSLFLCAGRQAKSQVRGWRCGSSVVGAVFRPGSLVSLVLVPGLRPQVVPSI